MRATPLCASPCPCLRRNAESKWRLRWKNSCLTGKLDDDAYIFNDVTSEPFLEEDAPRLLPLWRAIRDLLPARAVSAHADDGRVNLAFGSAQSGVSFHHHAFALNLAAVGRRRWFILPKADTTLSALAIRNTADGIRYTMARWLKEVYPLLRGKAALGASFGGFECVQQPGELL